MTHLKSSRDLQAQGRVDGAAKRGATNKKLKTRHVIMFLSARLVSSRESEKRVKNLKQFKHSHMNDAVIVCARAELSSRQSSSIHRSSMAAAALTQNSLSRVLLLQLPFFFSVKGREQNGKSLV